MPRSTLKTNKQTKKKNPYPNKKGNKDLNRHFSKENIQVANKHGEKNVQHLSSFWRCKSKPQDTTLHPLRCGIIQKNWIMSFRRDVEKSEASYTADVNVKWCSHIEKQ